MRLTFLTSVSIVALLSLTLPIASLAISPSQVTLNFMCPCGSCDEALSTCECPSSDGYRSQIAGMLGRGYSEQQIIQDFKGRFGPEVLIANAAMAPNSGGQLVSKRTFGFMLLIASFTLAAFALGRYMAPAQAAPATRTRRKRESPPQERPAGKKTRRGTGKGKASAGSGDGIDDELLDDYVYK